jgi:hypothetical protein
MNGFAADNQLGRILTLSGHLAGRQLRFASMLRMSDQNSLALIVSWLDLVKSFILNLSMVFNQSNLSN